MVAAHGCQLCARLEGWEPAGLHQRIVARRAGQERGRHQQEAHHLQPQAAPAHRQPAHVTTPSRLRRAVGRSRRVVLKEPCRGACASSLAGQNVPRAGKWRRNGSMGLGKRSRSARRALLCPPHPAPSSGTAHAGPVDCDGCRIVAHLPYHAVSCSASMHATALQAIQRFAPFPGSCTTMR